MSRRSLGQGNILILVQKLEGEAMDILIVDTNALLADPWFVLDFDLLLQYQVVILKAVVEELDYLKSREGITGYQAREASRFIEHLILASPKLDGGGWQVSPNCTLILDELIESRLSDDERRGSYDDRILASVSLYVKEARSSGNAVWLVTLDRNMRIRAEAREIPWLNPATWLPLQPNTYVIPIATYGLVWKAQGNVGVRLPVELGEVGEGWVEVWPYWGYPSGQFSTLHARLFEPTYKGPSDQDKASPVLILSTESRIRYPFRMEGIPYKVVQACLEKVGVVYHKRWKLEVEVRRCEVGNPVRISEAAKHRALLDLAYGASYLGSTNLVGNIFRGALIGQAVGTLTAEAKASPVFTRLSLVLRVLEATPDEIERALLAEETRRRLEKQEHTARKRRNTWILAVLLIIVVLIAVLPVVFCVGLYFLRFLFSLLS